MNLVARARRLRREQTDAERLLWGYLRARRLNGFRFKRQAPRAPYIVDFICSDRSLVIELDGSQHGADAALAYDARRTVLLEREGLRVLRFWNSDVMQNLHGVLDTILIELEKGKA